MGTATSGTDGINPAVYTPEQRDMLAATIGPENYAAAVERFLGGKGKHVRYPGSDSDVSNDSAPASNSLTASVSNTVGNGISDLLAAVGLQQNKLQAGSDALSALSAKQASIQDVITGIFTKSAADASIIQGVTGAHELAVQQAKNKIGNTLGTDANATSEVYTALNNEANKAYKDRAEARNEIERKQATSIFDNPLDFIVSKLTINQDIAKHNAANERLSSAEERLQFLNAQSEAGTRLQNQYGESFTAASQDAKTRQVAAQALIQAQQSAQQAAVYNANGINTVMAMAKERIAVGFQEENAKNAAAHLAVTYQQLDLQKQEFDQRKEKFAWDKTKYQNEQDFDNSLMDNINKGLEASGQPKLSGSAGKQAVALLKTGGAAGKRWSDYFIMGQQSNNAGFPVLGTSIGNTANVMNDVPVLIAPIQQPVKDVIAAAYKEVTENPAKYHIADLKDKNAVALAVSAVGNAKIAEMAGNVDPPTNPSNVFNIGSFNALAAQSPEIRKLPLWNKVFAPNVANGSQYVDPKLVWAQTVQAMKDGKVSFNEAVDGLSTMAQVGVDANIAARKFITFGIIPPKTYNVNIDFGSRGKTYEFGDMAERALTSGSGTVDWVKKDLVGRALITTMTRTYGLENTNKAILGVPNTLQQPPASPYGPVNTYPHIDEEDKANLKAGYMSPGAFGGVHK